MSQRKLTALENKALTILAVRPTTAALLGQELWAPPRTTASRAAAWARSAGKLLKRLKHMGLVYDYYEGPLRLWRKD